MTSLLGPGAVGVLGLELVGLGGLLGVALSLTELFLNLEAAPIPLGTGPPCIELASESCLLSLSPFPVNSSPKKPCSFFLYRPPKLDLDPCDETVVPLATEGLRSSCSCENVIPSGGAKPGDIWPRFSLESL